MNAFPRRAVAQRHRVIYARHVQAGDGEDDDRSAADARTLNHDVADFVLVYDDHGDPLVPEGHVVVRVQGGVQVFGGARRIDRRRSVELVVYLAVHPEGVDEQQIMEALWPDANPTRSAFNETISRARRCLGLDPTGEHHVRHFERGRYRLGRYVHLETRRPTRPGDQLSLPFRGCAGYEWAYAEGIAYALEAESDAAG